jgi:hypothetical protein
MSSRGVCSDVGKLVTKSACHGRHVVEPAPVHSTSWAEADVWLESGSICIDCSEKSDFRFYESSCLRLGYINYSCSAIS